MHYGFSDDETEVLELFGRLANTAQQTLEPRTEPDAAFWDELVQGGWLDAWALNEGELAESVLVALGIELGRVTPAVPWTNVFGYVGTLLSEVDTDAAAALRERLSDGALIVGAWRDASAIRCDTSAHGHVKLSGAIGLVPYGADAETIIAPVDVAGERVLVSIAVGDAGVHADEVPTVDLRHRFADVRLEQAEGTVIATAADGLKEALVLARRRLSLLFSAEAVGGLARLVDDAIRYTTDRMQFGVAIGSFQAVKHHVAHAATTLENGRALTYLAASTLGTESGSSGADIAAARDYTARNYLLGAEQMIQVHGGFGFTWDAGRHVGYRNAMSNVRCDPDVTPGA